MFGWDLFTTGYASLIARYFDCSQIFVFISFAHFLNSQVSKALIIFTKWHRLYKGNCVRVLIASFADYFKDNIHIYISSLTIIIYLVF